MTLNGDGDAEGEALGSTGPAHRSPYGPGGDEDDEWAAVTSQRKNRKGQRARQAKAKAVEARKRGEKWDSSVNWRAPKKPAEEVDDSGLAVKDKETKIVLKAAVGGMGKEVREGVRALFTGWFFGTNSLDNVLICRLASPRRLTPPSFRLVVVRFRFLVASGRRRGRRTRAGRRRRPTRASWSSRVRRSRSTSLI